MKKIKASSADEWLDLETKDHAAVVRALLDYRPFYEAVTYPSSQHSDDRRFYCDREKMPRKTFTCPTGHPILQVVLDVDVCKNITQPKTHPYYGLPDVALGMVDGDKWVPFDQWRFRSTSTQWGNDNPWGEGWYCYYEDEAGEHCRVPLPWGSKFCDEHADEPDPEVPEVPWDEKVLVVCPEVNCRYRGVHRRSSLLIEYALACVTRRQHIKFTS